MRSSPAERLYKKTLSLSDGLANELNLSAPHNCFKVLQKHIRFHVLDILVKRQHNMDLKYYILSSHHEGDQLSQRDIIANIKRIAGGLEDNERLIIIREAFDEVWRILKAMSVFDTRERVKSALSEFDYISEREKRNFLDKAIGDDGENVFLERLRTFDQKTIANFIAVFGLCVRGEDEKNNGKSTKNKLSKHRTDQNHKMWSNTQKRKKLCRGMKRSWRIRKTEALYPE
jgi:hypothetical protein